MLKAMQEHFQFFTATISNFQDWIIEKEICLLGFNFLYNFYGNARSFVVQMMWFLALQ